MNRHSYISRGVKVQRFCLTLGRKARLWYESLKLIALVYKISLEPLLGYDKPQVSEVFQNTMRLYWVLFPIEDFRLMVERAQRILKKEKIDKQLVGQSSSNPFMNI